MDPLRPPSPQANSTPMTVLRPQDFIKSNRIAASAATSPAPREFLVGGMEQICPELPSAMYRNGSMNGYGMGNLRRTSESTPIAEIDFPLLLLSLAEEYLESAQRKRISPEDQDDCESLAMSFACFDAVLRNAKFEPQLEAMVRLRYAELLYEETENWTEAEEALNKGILICERHKLLDLKYNMQHLLARVTFATNPRAAVKFLDMAIQHVEAYQHLPWVYSLRFLRASLSLQMATFQETLVAISHLKIVATLATGRRDRAVAAMASTIEAMIHIHRGNHLDSIEQAQRAIAAARSSQWDHLAQSLPQLTAMILFADLCCSIQQGDGVLMNTKLLVLHTMLDNTSSHPTWTNDGAINVPLSPESGRTLSNSGSTPGIIKMTQEGHLTLQLKWIPKAEIYTLGYILSAAVVANRGLESRKAEKFLGQASLSLQHLSSSRLDCLPAEQARTQDVLRHALQCQVLIQSIFLLCGRSLWSEARQKFCEVQALSDRAPDGGDNMDLFLLYIAGLIEHGTGKLEHALAIYQSPQLAISSTGSVSTTTQLRRDLCILAALNSVIIIRPVSHHQHHLLTPLMAALAPLALDNPSRNIHAAFHLIRATSNPSSQSDLHGGSSIIKTKEYLTSALQAAKQANNNQLICITLHLMSFKYFRGVVAEQAEKSARASQALASKGRDFLWCSVAAGNLAEVLEMQGKGGEAAEMRAEGVKIAAMLPTDLWRSFGDGRDALET